MASYSYLQGVLKSVKYALLFFFGFLLDGFLAASPLANMTWVSVFANSAFGGLTIGGFFVFLYNHLKIRWGFRIP